MPAVAHRSLRSQRRMVSMITRCLDGDRDVMIMMLARRLVT